VPTATVQDQITRVVTYPVSQERLWKAVTEREQLEQWFGPSKIEMDARAGGEMFFAFSGGQTSRAVIDEIHPMDRFVWKWKAAGADDKTKALLDQDSITTISFLLRPVDGGTELTITEVGFAAITPQTEAEISYPEHIEGWDHMVTQLNGYLANG